MGEVSYKGHRYPAEIIAHCVWLYHRFPLSFREVEELMLVRGVIVTHETIRQWCAKFGPVYAAGLRRRQPRPPAEPNAFLAVFSVISPHFRPRRHRLTADDYRTEMADRFATWNDITRSSEAA